MVSKSRQQRQKQKAKKMSGDTEPTQISTNKSVHLKKTRPNMKGKMKIRLGHESADIYDGFEDSKQVSWKCPTCNRVGRVHGFCVECESKKVDPQALQSRQKQEDKAVKAAASASGKSVSGKNSNVRSGKAAKKS